MPVQESESANSLGPISVVSSEAQEPLTESTWPIFSYVMSEHKNWYSVCSVEWMSYSRNLKNQFVLGFVANSGVQRMKPKSNILFVA